MTVHRAIIARTQDVPDLLDPRSLLDEPGEGRLYLSRDSRLFVTLDADDAAWAAQWVWCAHFNQHGLLYPARQVGAWPGPRRRVYLHRAIMERIAPAPSPEHQVDHKDGDALNARRSNLRWVTRSENAKNTWLYRLAHGVPA